jgi:hypothetical protein
VQARVLRRFPESMQHFSFSFLLKTIKKITEQVSEKKDICNSCRLRNSLTLKIFPFVARQMDFP